MKRVHLISVVIAMLLVLPFAIVSCSNSGNGLLASTAVSSVEIVTPTTTPTQNPTSTPTITPSPTPIPTQVHSDEDDLAMAPDISGLSKEVQDGKVVYLATAGNKYGLDEGEFAGEYNPNVSVKGTEVGGVALEPSVVDKFLTDELAKIPEGEKQMKIIIPLDITEVTAETGFNIEDTIETGLSEYVGKESHIMIIEFNNPLTFISPCNYEERFLSIDKFTVGSTFKKADETIKTIDVEQQAGLTTYSCFDDSIIEKGNESVYFIFNQDEDNLTGSEEETPNAILNFDETKPYVLGEKMSVQAKSVLSVWFDYYDIKDTTPNDLLTLPDGTVVFTYPQATVGDEATLIPTN